MKSLYSSSVERVARPLCNNSSSYLQHQQLQATKNQYNHHHRIVRLNNRFLFHHPHKKNYSFIVGGRSKSSRGLFLAITATATTLLDFVFPPCLSSNMNLLQRAAAFSGGGTTTAASGTGDYTGTTDGTTSSSRRGPGTTNYPEPGNCTLTDAYNFVRGHYTDSSQVVPRFQNSESNLSQASLNRRMLQMLELQRGQTIADLGSGCGITANTFAYFGCSVVDGFEYHKKSL